MMTGPIKVSVEYSPWNCQQRQTSLITIQSQGMWCASRYCRPSVRWPWDSLHGWLALSWGILHRRDCIVIGLIKLPVIYGLKDCMEIHQHPEIYYRPQDCMVIGLIKLHIQSGPWDCKG